MQCPNLPTGIPSRSAAAKEHSDCRSTSGDFLPTFRHVLVSNHSVVAIGDLQPFLCQVFHPNNSRHEKHTSFLHKPFGFSFGLRTSLRPFCKFLLVNLLTVNYMENPMKIKSSGVNRVNDL